MLALFLYIVYRLTILPFFPVKYFCLFFNLDILQLSALVIPFCIFNYVADIQITLSCVVTTDIASYYSLFRNFRNVIILYSRIIFINIQMARPRVFFICLAILLWQRMMRKRWTIHSNL